MSPLTAARVQMELSLGFHMLFAAVGMAMPVMMIIAERRWMRYRDADALGLARTWARLTAVVFAIGAVSGTALSFELGLLWPRFMAFAGPLVGPAFALEGFAFFVEAIFLGLYLYGWNRLSPMAHWLSGWAVAISGGLSGVIVLATNAWMQQPGGFTLGAADMPASIDPWVVLINPAWPGLALHSTLSTYQAVGFAAAGAFAWFLRRGGSRRAELGIAIALAVGGSAAIIQPISGDLLAKRLHRHQPVKLAAMEGQFVTERRAPLRVGGLPDEQTQTTPYAIEIPGLLSFLAANDFDAEVIGLDRIPRDEWPPVLITHVAFQIMVACGIVMLVVAVWYGATRWRYRTIGFAHPGGRWLLLALVVCAPLGYIALQAGWVVTEVGRQPWVIYRVMRTADAVTPEPHVAGSLALFTLLYAALLVILAVFLRRLARGDQEGAEAR